VILCAERESGKHNRGGSTRRWKASWPSEGPLPLTRRRRRGVRRSNAMGTWFFLDGEARSAADREKGRQRRRRKSDHGREHRGRKAKRGGAVDRGSTRTALCPSRGRSGYSPRASQKHPLWGLASWLRRELKLELCRQALAPSGWLTGNAGTGSPQDLVPLGSGPG